MCTNFTISLCVLNQWALDFTGNTQRILDSIRTSKRLGAQYRLGPELELSGYGCEDHFHEPDTFEHSWQCLMQILAATAEDAEMQNIICDIGMPILFSGVAYNCRVIILNGHILFIRPKMVLAEGGLHRETRWFTAWPHRMKTVDFPLPSLVKVAKIKSQTRSVPFGDALLRFTNSVDQCVTIGLELCEELWIGTPPHLQMYSSGADVIVNGSASHHELRKLSSRINLVQMASRSSAGGFYAYTNLRGCDSERICYDGGAMAALSGELVCLTKQFSLDEVEVQIVNVDLKKIRSRRVGSKSFGETSAAAFGDRLNTYGCVYPILDFSFPACTNLNWLDPKKPNFFPKRITTPPLLRSEEEIAYGPSLWLWDMLRRSQSSGFFLCLSGGLDSASVACLVFALCHQVCTAAKEGNAHVIAQCRKMLRENDEYIPSNARELCSRILTTCYMPSDNSSVETESRAQLLAEAIGSRHLNANISSIVTSLVNTTVKSLQMSTPPRFTVHGGSDRESLALQNVQARSRLTLSYLLAQLIPDMSNLPGGLLVLSTANLDEGLRGYFTKYDCSSADLNPIGSISKIDLRRFLSYCAETMVSYVGPELELKFKDVLHRILTAQPTAELMPLQSDGSIKQTDEEDMGLTYNMLSVFGRLRKIESCGPYSMLRHLLDGAWYELKCDIPSDCLASDGTGSEMLAKFLGDKVKHFFRSYAINRHKTTILPPSYHMESYSADDNRFDLRPCLYPADFSHQFKCIDELISEWEVLYKQSRH